MLLAFHIGAEFRQSPPHYIDGASSRCRSATGADPRRRRPRACSPFDRPRRRRVSAASCGQPARHRRRSWGADSAPVGGARPSNQSCGALSAVHAGALSVTRAPLVPAVRRRLTGASSHDARAAARYRSPWSCRRRRSADGGDAAGAVVRAAPDGVPGVMRGPTISNLAGVLRRGCEPGRCGRDVRLKPDHDCPNDCPGRSSRT